MRPIALDRRLFDRLAAERGEALVSVYLPTHVKGAEVDQDQIRLKNGLTQVDGTLEDAGWKPRERGERLEPSLRLLDDQEFWAHQGQGLAVFIDDESSSTAVALPDEAAELCVVSDVFHLRPMLRSLEPVELPVLVLTLGGVRLYRTSRHQTDRVDIDLPDSFDDVNWFVDREKQRQQHADRAGSKRSRHGHEPASARGEDLDRFFRAVDAALPVAEEPLIVLGDDNIVARFGLASERGIQAEPDGGVADVDDIHAIHAAAGGVVGRHQSLLDEESVELALQELGTGNATTDLEESLQAAVSGRVSRVVLHAGASPRWGRFDPSTLETSMHDAREPFDVDLIDRLAVHALGTGAGVVPVEGTIDGHDFVTILRY
ncbi:MAG: hypothetical protein WCE80_07470 [Acidimicrobiia bacterium]